METAENENHNLGLQKFIKNAFNLFFQVKKISKWEKTLERMLKFWPSLSSNLYEGICHYFIHSFRLIDVMLIDGNAPYLYVALLQI